MAKTRGTKNGGSRQKISSSKSKSAPAKSGSKTSKGSSASKSGSKPKRPVKVVSESESGRNETFKLPNGEVASRPEFVRQIERGRHPDYHVRIVGGVKTPASNPDGNDGNNLD